MANNNRNRDYSHYASDENWDKNENRYRNEDRYQPGREDYDRVNYMPDNDENRRNYNRDYENNPYGSSGTYGNRGREEDQYRQSGYGQAGGDYRRNYNRDYEEDQWQQRQRGGRDYGDMRNTSYGSVYGGNVERRAEETNRAVGGRYERMARNRPDYDRGHGYTGDYGGAYGAGNRMGAYSSDYNQGQYDYDDRSRYGREDQDWWDRTKNKVSNWFDSDDDRDRNTATMTGPHRGKGPKGYRRSDERILEEVSDRLSDDDRLDASDIEIKVLDAEVILEGRVDDKEAKRRAEDLAEKVSGVSNVQNNLKVSPIVGTRTTNAVISAVAEKNNPTYANQMDQDKNRNRE